MKLSRNFDTTTEALNKRPCKKFSKFEPDDVIRNPEEWIEKI